VEALRGRTVADAYCDGEGRDDVHLVLDDGTKLWIDVDTDRNVVVEASGGGRLVHGGSRRGRSARSARSSSNPYRSMEGGSVDELLDVTVERPVLDQLQVEVGRTLEDRVQPGLTGDDREERHLQAVD
jgi:hypothetical protein